MRISLSPFLYDVVVIPNIAYNLAALQINQNNSLDLGE